MAGGNIAVVFFLLLGCAWAQESAGGCVARSYGYGSVACVCTAARCDEPPGEPAGGLRAGQVLRVVSTSDGQRLNASLATLAQEEDASADAVALNVSGAAAARQEILGFGGAVTDSAALNILSLSEGAQKRLLGQLFGRDGSRYSVVRVPIAGTDFSTHNYTYDDGTADPQLKNFSLTAEDVNWKIPVLHEISKLVGEKLHLFASVWNAPDWMIVWTEGGYNHLNPDYYQLWADYFVKFLDAYKSEGLSFWGLTQQNEPNDGYGFYYSINHMGWSPESAGAWIRDYLGPTLHERGYGNLKLMIHDEQRNLLPEWPERTLNDSKTQSFVSGIAVHWYTDGYSSPDLLTQTHDLFPDKFILYTEACDGPFMSAGDTVQLGNWTRGENYAQDIIQVINNWGTGWVDWNMALDPDGGPSYANNEVDASIIVNATADEFLKQPTHYALTHFSRYVPQGSRHVPVTLDSSASDEDLFATAFITPDNRYVIVLLNRDSEQHEISITLDDLQGQSFKDTLPEHSITTLVIRSN